jgi:hypothetical protein
MMSLLLSYDHCQSASRVDYLNDTPAPGKQLEEQHDHREYDQGVNEAATHAEAKAESPQDEQNDHYGPQHKSSTSLLQISLPRADLERSSFDPLNE